MKIKLSELRDIIKEELGMVNEDMGASSQVVSPNLQQAVERIVNMFPNLVTNQILDQKMGMGGADNQSRIQAAAQTKEYVDQAAQKFRQDLEGVIERHFVETVKNFKPTEGTPPGAGGQRPMRPVSGSPENPQNRPTIPVPRG